MSFFRHLGSKYKVVAYDPAERKVNVKPENKGYDPGSPATLPEYEAPMPEHHNAPSAPSAPAAEHEQADDNDTEKRKAALLKHLGLDDDELSEIEEARHGDNLFEHGREEYLVLTDDEADALTKENILDSLWAFRPEFLESHTGIDAEVFEKLQEKSEDSNESIKKLIKKAGDLDHLVDDAIKADGRGHFLSSYDGEENDEGGFYIYRVN